MDDHITYRDTRLMIPIAPPPEGFLEVGVTTVYGDSVVQVIRGSLVKITPNPALSYNGHQIDFPVVLIRKNREWSLDYVYLLKCQPLKKQKADMCLPVFLEIVSSIPSDVLWEQELAFKRQEIVTLQTMIPEQEKLVLEFNGDLNNEQDWARYRYECDRLSKLIWTLESDEAFIARHTKTGDGEVRR